MGFTRLLSLSPSSLCYPGLNPTKTPRSPKFSSLFRCSSSSRPDWDPNSDAFGAGRFGFDEEFGFGERQKRRKWWSDDDDEEEDDGDEDFEFWEEPSAIDWIFKVFKAFGWMVPAVLVSILMGTGPNSLIMALVLPFGQTALSLVMDKLWGGPSSDPDSRPRPRPRAGSRSRSRFRSRRNPFNGNANEKACESRAGTRWMRGGYQSWGAANSTSAKKGTKSKSSFGGWDELDERDSSYTDFSTEEQNQKTDELHRQESGTGKLSRRRSRGKPLFIRLLIAVFPILDSWTRFFL